MCKKHQVEMVGCSIVKLQCLWKEWLESGMQSYQDSDYSKALFYFGNARDVAFAEFSQAEFTAEAIEHLVVSSLLVARMFRALDEIEMEQVCLSTTFHYFGHKIHLKEHENNLTLAMKTLLDISLHSEYIIRATGKSFRDIIFEPKLSRDIAGMH